MKSEDEMTDDGAERLLHPLRGEPSGPPRYDVARAMAEGRRRRGLRRWTTGAALVAVTSLTAGGGTFAVAAMRPEPAPTEKPAPVTSTTPSVEAAAAAAAPAPKSCKVRMLPTGGVRKSLVSSGDPSGHWHAGRLYYAAENVILWKDGRIAAKVRMPGADAEINDLTTAGVGVGSSFPGEEQQAYVYRDGAFSALDGAETVARAINEAGVIVGAIGKILDEAPARWRSAGAKVERLPLPDGATKGMADLVTEDGTVIGTVGTESHEQSGYIWSPDGTGTTIPLPTVDGRKADYFWPTSTADGWILGRAVFETETDEKDPRGNNIFERTFAVLRYRISDGTIQRLPKSFQGTYAMLAGNGWVLGTSGMDDPVILSGEKIMKLPEYRTFKEYVPTSFSEDGKVSGGYTTDMGPDDVDNRPILWTCE
ncbi:hypothetical protein [Actinoplanes couchii]|uniref:Uncharacterized protein n=1 Tax=Actinoplanes couchii TaxID=403638 RepID=A0ABQ3X3Q4_9ACTN|nr:hypothetical protein [Actinoplanes couchii]MDR6322906.1 hypothetical protein [Actinoplanes couchii]GID53146.1 hypothetical protein Aco03nite_015500 [Actinoplanes couchii]